MPKFENELLGLLALIDRAIPVLRRDLYPSKNTGTIRVTTSNRTRWAEHVALFCVGEKSNG